MSTASSSYGICAIKPYIGRPSSQLRVKREVLQVDTSTADRVLNWTSMGPVDVTLSNFGINNRADSTRDDVHTTTRQGRSCEVGLDDE